MVCKDSDYTVVIAIMHHMSSPYNFRAETHLGDEDTSAFVVPSAAIARSLSSKFRRRQYSSYEGPHKDSDHTGVIAVVH